MEQNSRKMKEFKNQKERKETGDSNQKEDLTPGEQLSRMLRKDQKVENNNSEIRKKDTPTSVAVEFNDEIVEELVSASNDIKKLKASAEWITKTLKSENLILGETREKITEFPVKMKDFFDQCNKILDISEEVLTSFDKQKELWKTNESKLRDRIISLINGLKEKRDIIIYPTIEIAKIKSEKSSLKEIEDAIKEVKEINQNRLEYIIQILKYLNSPRLSYNQLVDFLFSNKTQSFFFCFLNLFDYIPIIKKYMELD